MKSLLPRCAILALVVLHAAVSVHAQAEATGAQDTIITSDGPLEMRNDGVEAYFVLVDNVRLTGTNLELTCDKLEAFAHQESDSAKGFGRIGKIRRIVATGNVVISQEGRRATAGRAEVLPDEDRIVLTENPVVAEPQGTIAGTWMEFFRGENKARVHEPRLLLRALPNLGFPRSPSEDDAQTPPPPEAPSEGSQASP